MIVLNHGNDRGLAIQGGRRTGNYAHGALKMIDNVGRLSNAIFIHGGAGQGVNYMGFYTGESTTTTERLRITSDGALQQTGTSGLSYFKGSSEYIFGSNSSSPPAGGYESVLQVQGAKTRSAFTVAAYMDNAGGPFMTFLSSRSGTVGTLGTKCINNDNLGGIRFAGDNATNYNSVAFGAEIFAKAKSTPADGDTIIAGELHFATGSGNGGSVSDRLIITSSGHVLPGANNTYDLGSTAKGWRNVYMNDLNLSNMKGNTNDVDGTQGSWTIQEGKDDLYIINRLNGKKFKIKMEEIS